MTIKFIFIPQVKFSNEKHLPNILKIIELARNTTKSLTNESRVDIYEILWYKYI